MKDNLVKKAKRTKKPKPATRKARPKSRKITCHKHHVLGGKRRGRKSR